MTDLSTYEAIRERLAGLTGPDRETDCRLHWLVQGERHWATITLPVGDETTWDGVADREISAPRYTGSVDAILALIERDLPAWCYFADDGWQAFGRTADPLALLPKHFCLAYIEAKIQIAKADAEGGQNG